MKVKSESEVAQSCPALSDPMDCSLPGSSFHGIFQARVLEWQTHKVWLASLPWTMQRFGKDSPFRILNTGSRFKHTHVWTYDLNPRPKNPILKDFSKQLFLVSHNLQQFKAEICNSWIFSSWSLLCHLKTTSVILDKPLNFMPWYGLEIIVHYDLTSLLWFPIAVVLWRSNLITYANKDPSQTFPTPDPHLCYSPKSPLSLSHNCTNL